MPFHNNNNNNKVAAEVMLQDYSGAAAGFFGNTRTAASLVLGTLYPEAIQRFTVDPNTYAQEERYIGNNIAMTRLAYGLDVWETKPYTGDKPLTEAAECRRWQADS